MSSSMEYSDWGMNTVDSKEKTQLFLSERLTYDIILCNLIALMIDNFPWHILSE